MVYRKCAGGGLLREPGKIDAILGALRDAVTIPFTVKTRIGFDSAEGFDELLGLFAKHAIDLLTVHGRTVKQMYRPGVRYDLIARAAGRNWPARCWPTAMSTARSRRWPSWPKPERAA